MSENIKDLLYVAKNLCDALRDRPNFLDIEDEIKELVEDLESNIEEIQEEA